MSATDDLAALALNQQGLWNALAEAVLNTPPNQPAAYDVWQAQIATVREMGEIEGAMIDLAQQVPIAVPQSGLLAGPYTVNSDGDTLIGIADRMRLDLASVLADNPSLLGRQPLAAKSIIQLRQTAVVMALSSSYGMFANAVDLLGAYANELIANVRAWRQAAGIPQAVMPSTGVVATQPAGAFLPGQGPVPPPIGQPGSAPNPSGYEQAMQAGISPWTGGGRR